MTLDPRDLRTEIALLRDSLWSTTRRLKDYQDAPCTPSRKGETLNVTIPASLREKAAEALEKANSVLVVKEGRGR